MTAAALALPTATVQPQASVTFVAHALADEMHFFAAASFDPSEPTSALQSGPASPLDVLELALEAALDDAVVPASMGEGPTSHE